MMVERWMKIIELIPKNDRVIHPPPSLAKRIKKVLKRNERDDLSLGTRLIMETGGTKGKGEID